MPLGDIAEDNNDRSGQHLCDNGIDVKLLYKYFEEYIVQHKVEQADHKIAEQLNSPFHFRITEDHVFCHKETDRESNTEGNEQGGAMCFKRIDIKVKFLFTKNVAETDKIDQEPEQRIAPAGCRIAKGLQVHQPAEWRIKKINYR
jgi:hypothetical protein